MLFWKSRNIEQEISNLAARVTKSRTHFKHTQLQKRRTEGLFLSYSTVCYFVFAIVVIATKSLSSMFNKAVIIGGPIVIYGIFKLLHAILSWREERARSQLEALENRRKGLVEEYKEKTNFYNIQKVIDSADSDKVDDKKQPPAAKTAAKKSKSSGKDSHKELVAKVQRESMKAHPVGSSVPPPEQPQSEQHAITTQSPSPMPVEPMHKPTWMDRLADLILGQDEISPNNRYALICPHCHTHNGLATFGQNPKLVTYRCPACDALNGPADTAEDRASDEKDAKPSFKTPEMQEVPSEIKELDTSAKKTE